MPTSVKTFVVERMTAAGPDGNREVEVKAERAEQDVNSTRVTFFTGDTAVGSFINVNAWYEKSTS